MNEQADTTAPLPLDDSHFARLVIRYLDRLSSDKEIEMLNAQLQASPERRDQFLQLSLQHTHLAELMSSQQFVAVDEAEQESETAESAAIAAEHDREVEEQDLEDLGEWREKTLRMEERRRGPLPRPAPQQVQLARRPVVRWLVVAAVLLVAAFFGVQYYTQIPGELCAEVIEVRGSADRIAGNAAAELTPGMLVSPGERIETRPACYVKLRYPDGTELEMNGETRATLEPYTRSAGAGKRVALLQGKLFAAVAPQPAGEPMIFNPGRYDQVIVHGTAFELNRDTDETTLRMAEGEVLFGEIEPVEVAAGTGCNATIEGIKELFRVELANLASWRPSVPDSLAFAEAPQVDTNELFPDPIDVRVPHVSTDKSVQYDYDIVYVRAWRAGDEEHKRFYTDFSQPVTLEPGADLMLLHPDGTEELLVAGGKGSITDPVVSFDAQWVYYTHIYNLEKFSPWSPPAAGADIYKIHLKTRKVVRLTNQQFVPNIGAADFSSDFRSNEKGKTHYGYGVFNMGAYPLPGGRLVFTSNREGFEPSKGYPRVALQLFVMDDRDESISEDERYPANIEKIGHLNIAGALHPIVLADGRIMFSTLESQGIRSNISWGIWTIHPDGTNWAPMISAFDPGGAANGFHFQAQLSDRSLIVEEYYNQNNSGFGAYVHLPAKRLAGQPAFGPGYMHDPRNVPWRFGRHGNGKGRWYRMPFMPTGSTSFTPFSKNDEGPANPSIIDDEKSPAVGKFTHPSGAPDNHLLTIYSPGPVNHQYKYLPQLDGGIYLIKDGKTLQQPADMRLIKNDPQYNESWPRAVVPYKRIYGIDEPKQLARLANDGSISKHLPAGTPYGLVGTSSMYKRESYPNGVVPKGQVTATYAGGNDPWKGLDAFTSHGNGMPINWHNQGGDAGLYKNSDIHAIRVLAMEPTTDRHRGERSQRLFYSHAAERLRILGEIPVRKFNGDEQPLDPDGNPDTSFLAKIPADVAFTFQTIDKLGMVLNMSQTWHQLRPGEKRVDCGGCHAHSQQPTLFESTRASRPDYEVWDLTKVTPLLTGKSRDESNKKWDKENETGLTLQKQVVSVEFYRDIRPILQRSCVACHTKDWTQPAGNLVLDSEDEQVEGRTYPGDYYRLCMDRKAKYGYKPPGYDSYGYPQASRYIRQLQSRRSLLAWKLFGARLDGFSNDDHPSSVSPDKPNELVYRGKQVPIDKFRAKADLDFTGSAMPPPEAVAGNYDGPNGTKIKVAPLSDEDRRTIVRWIDLGCPIDLDYNPNKPLARGFGWMCDDNRPTLALTAPVAGANPPLSRILLGIDDYHSGIAPDSLVVTADFPLAGLPAGDNLAARFQSTSSGVWELKLKQPLKQIHRGTLTVKVRDLQGNESEIVRTFSVK